MVRSRSRDGENDTPSQPAVDWIDNDATVSHPQWFGETQQATASSFIVDHNLAPLLAPDHCYSSTNVLAIEHSRTEIMQPPLDRLIKISPHSAVVVEGLSSFSHDSPCLSRESKSGNHNHCRNNNTDQTLPGGNVPPVRIEYPYKGAVKNHGSRRTVKKSRLIIVVLVCIIAGLAAGLAYFLLHGDADTKVPTVSDVPPSGSSNLRNQTRVCAKMPSKYLSSALGDGPISTGRDYQANDNLTITPTVETVSEELSSGDLPKRTQVQARIYGGTSVTVSRFPWQVSLWLKDRGMFCGGALIMPNWIVTAAHCTYYDRNATDWTAYVGVSRLSEKSSPPAQTAKVESIFINPHYKATWNYDNDISLLKLSESVRFSSHVQPICLPQLDQEFGDESSCSISGWGSIANTGEMIPPEILQFGKVDIFSQETCRSDDWLGEFLVTENMICAGKADGSIDACSGDSGGPLSCYVKERGVWVVAGVVSFGRGCGQPKQPGVYTKISAFIEWIWTTIGEND